jgi:hypothetical protein
MTWEFIDKNPHNLTITQPMDDLRMEQNQTGHDIK